MTVSNDPNAPRQTTVAPAGDTAVREDRVVERQSWMPGFGAGMILGALGAIGVIVSCFIEWTEPDAKPVDIPVAFLGDNGTTSTDPSLLIALLPIAVVLVIGAFVPMGSALRILGGIAMIVVVGLFIFQLDDAVDGGLGDVLGTGVYVGGIGGILALISGFAGGSWLRKREVVRSDTVERA